MHTVAQIFNTVLWHSSIIVCKLFYYVPIYSISLPSFNSDKLFNLLVIACVVVMREIKCVFHSLVHLQYFMQSKSAGSPAKDTPALLRRVTFGILWNYCSLYNQNYFASLFYAISSKKIIKPTIPKAWYINHQITIQNHNIKTHTINAPRQPKNSSILYQSNKTMCFAICIYSVNT